MVGVGSLAARPTLENVDPEREGDGPQRRRPPRPRRPPKDNPAREYNRPPGAKLFDVSGLLIVVGLVAAGFVLALILTKHLL
jgi:hypothetical protein